MDKSFELNLNKVSASPESAKERIFSREEIIEVFMLFAGNKPFESIREKSDKDGIYLLEINIKGENGEVVEYQYTRKGNYYGGKNVLPSTCVYMAVYESDSSFKFYPEVVAEYDEDKRTWQDRR